MFNPGRTRVVQHLDADEFRDLLNDAAQDSLRSIFGPAIVRKSETAAAVPKHTGTASLGVLRTNDANLTVQTSFGKPDVRVHFGDPALGALAIKVTDLRVWEVDQVTPAAEQIERIKNKLDDSYLAVGLSRAFPVPSYEGVWHWLQINNVFPLASPLWARERGSCQAGVKRTAPNCRARGRTCHQAGFRNPYPQGISRIRHHRRKR